MNTPPTPADEIATCATDAAAAVQQLCRLTITRPRLAPAEVDAVLADLAAAVGTVGAFPQAATRLADLLEHVRRERHLEMDNLTDGHDPDTAIDMARLHLDVTKVHALDLYRSLNAAHHQTAHIG